MRAVLDVNILISALLSPRGAPAELLRRWLRGDFELIVSPLLLAELRRALAHPKLRRRIPPDDAEQLLDWLERAALLAMDGTDPPAVRSPNPGDDYLLALAAAEAARLVSGDDHLLSLDERLPIVSPRAFLELLADRD